MLFNALKIYSQLTTQQKTFISSKEINGDLSARQWVKLLEPLCKYDQLADALKPRLVLWTAIFFGLFFVSLFFLSSTVLSYTLFYSTITLLFLYLFFYKSDVNNNVRDLVFPLLQMLSLEVGNTKKINMRINFCKTLAKKDIFETVKSNGVSNFYRYEVLEINSQLIDNSHFNLKVVDTIRQRTRSNGRKTKIKIKLNRKIALQMTFSRDSYKLNNKRVINGVKLKETDKKITFKQQFKQSSPGVTALIDLKPILNAAHLSYSYLQEK